MCVCVCCIPQYSKIKSYVISIKKYQILNTYYNCEANWNRSWNRKWRHSMRLLILHIRKERKIFLSWNKLPYQHIINIFFHLSTLNKSLFVYLVKLREYYCLFSSLHIVLQTIFFYIPKSRIYGKLDKNKL